MNEIEAYSKINDRAGLDWLGNAILRSNMFGVETKEQGNILALQCIVEKKPPLELAKHYHIVKGRLSKKSESMLAEFKHKGGKVKWINSLKDPKEQKAVFTYDGESVENSFTIEDANNAGLTPDHGGTNPNWKIRPAAMLRARLVTETMRAIAPEIVCGTYEPDEIYEIENHKQTQADAELAERAYKAAETRNAERAEKPEAEEPEIVDSDLDEQLAAKIGENEKDVNEYWMAKTKGGIDIGQTWRDLPDSKKEAMLSDFDAFIKAAKGGAK